MIARLSDDTLSDGGISALIPRYYAKEERSMPAPETITKLAEIAHTYSSVEKREYARVTLRLEPLAQSTAFEFVNAIVGDAVPARFVAPVERGVREAAKNGIVNNGPVVGCRVTLWDGSYHDVDSNEDAFFRVAKEAFRLGMKSAGAKLAIASI
jgi:elongation factor G